MIKVHFPEFDQEALLKEVGKAVTFIDTSTNIKSASSSAFSEELIRNNMPDDDHFAVHFIAIGDTEQYGFNRNGDGFSKKANQDYHHTFVDHGHFFREHKNNDPIHKIGDIKAAAYNEKMHRSEVIVHGHKKLAAEEYELAKAGKPLSCSMACKIASDRCSICGNLAAHRGQYCDHLANHLGQYMPEHRKFAFAHNDQPVFFDLSRVKNPADRIAHYLQYSFSDDMSKAAHVHTPIGGAELAELLDIRLHGNAMEFTSKEASILKAMAEHEEYLEKVANGEDLPRDNKLNFVKHALHLLISSDTSSDSMINPLNELDLPVLMQKLMQKETMLPYKSFYSMVNGESAEGLDCDPTFLHSKHTSLPKAIRMIVVKKSPVLKLEGMKNTFDPAGDYTANMMGCMPDEVQKALNHFIENFSLKQMEQPTKKIVKVISEPKQSLSAEFQQKEAAIVDNTKSELTAGLYGLYKLSFVKHLQDSVDDPKLLTITYFK